MPAGIDCGLEAVSRAIVADVVAHLQDLSGDVRAAGDDLDGTVDVAGERVADLVVLDQQHHRGDVLLWPREAWQRVEDAADHATPDEFGRVLRWSRRHSCVGNSGSEGGPSRGGAGIAAVEHLEHGAVSSFQHIHQPAYMVSVGVRDDHHINVGNALRTQVASAVGLAATGHPLQQPVFIRHYGRSLLDDKRQQHPVARLK